MQEVPTVFAVFEERRAWESSNPELAKAGLGRFLEDEESIGVIVEEIRASGIPVQVWQYSKQNLSGLLKALKTEQRPILWNLTDGHELFRGSYFPAFMRLAGVPHIGSGSYAQMLCQHKHHLKAVAESMGIAASRGILFGKYSRRPFAIPPQIPPPYFVKPACLDNSIGDSFVPPICYDSLSALQAVEALVAAGIEEVLVEEYLPGDEFSFVAINGGQWVAECPQLHHSGPGYFSGELKDAEAYSYTYSQTEAISEMLVKGRLLASLLRLYDYYRVDFRVDVEGRPRLLEINTNPFLISKIFDDIAHRHFEGRPEMFRRMIFQSFMRQLPTRAKIREAAH